MDKKRFLQSVLVFLFFGTFVTLANITAASLNYDLIWCFHISQKVANGFNLYSEIGTVVTPIYFWLGSLFIKIFGNSLISMQIYSGVVCGGITTVIFNIIKETMNKENKLAPYIFIFWAVLLCSQISLTNYNSTALLFVFIAIFIEIRKETRRIDANQNITSKKENLYNLLIGLFLGIAFFTKQNVGALGVFATGTYSLIYKCFIKKENTIKEILLKASGFLSVFAVMMIYFACTNTIVDFFNFCFGGLLEFGNKNLKFGMPVGYIGVLIIIYLACAIVKDEKTNNNLMVLEVLYLIFLMFLIYPLTNSYHMQIGMIMAFPLTILILNKVVGNHTFYSLLATLFLLFLRLAALSGGVTETSTEVMFGNTINNFWYIINIFITFYLIIFASGIVADVRNIMKSLSFGCAILAVFLGVSIYIDNIEANSYLPERLSIYKNFGLSEEVTNYINDVVEYILEKEAQGYDVYVVSADASYYMAALGRNQYKYDLNLYGSLGYDGENVLIEETKMLKNALILKDENIMHQEPMEFDAFIKETYTVVDKVGSLIVYSTEGKM